MSEKKLTEKEQIQRLKEIALSSTITSTRQKVMDTLATYGEKAIPAITDIIDNSSVVATREYGLDVVKEIKEKSRA